MDYNRKSLKKHFIISVILAIRMLGVHMLVVFPRDVVIYDFMFKVIGISLFLLLAAVFIFQMFSITPYIIYYVYIVVKDIYNIRFNRDSLTRRDFTYIAVTFVLITYVFISTIFMMIEMVEVFNEPWG